jgi:hypothetical protein
MVLNKDSNTSRVVKGGEKLLEPHIAVNWLRELALAK